MGILASHSSFITKRPIFSGILYLKRTQLVSLGVNLYIKLIIAIKKREGYYTINKRLKKSKKYPSELRKNKNYLGYFTSLACKNGYKLKTSRIVKNSFKLFFELFLFCNDDAFSKKYFYFSVLKSYSQSWHNFFGINYFLNLFLPFYESIFLLRCVKLPKTKKKRKGKGKKKKLYKLDVVYLLKKKRLHNVIKLIYVTTSFYQKYSFSDRLFCALVDTFFLLNKSKLHNLKIETYKKVMSLRKTQESITSL